METSPALSPPVVPTISSPLSDHTPDGTSCSFTCTKPVFAPLPGAPIAMILPSVLEETERPSSSFWPPLNSPIISQSSFESRRNTLATPADSFGIGASVSAAS